MADYSGLYKGLLPFLLSGLFACNTIEPIHKVQEPDFQKKIPSIVQKFVDISTPNRTSGSFGNEKAFDFIKGQFDEIASEIKGRVIVHEFIPDIDFAQSNYEKDFNTMIKGRYPPNSAVYKKWRLFTDNAVRFLETFRSVKGRNLILEIPGRRNPEEVIYVGAHYDTMIVDQKTLKFLPQAPAPGADNNASAIGLLLTVAKELKNEHPDRTIRFVAFDFEEIFFLGSYALARDLNSLKPRWMRVNEQTTSLFNFDMIGWSKTKLADHPVVKLYTRAPKVPGRDQDSLLANAFLRAAKLLKSPLKALVLQNGFNRSDNWSFWQNSFASICISQDWEKDFNSTHYHTSSDTPDTLNFPYLEEITRVTVEMLSELSRNNLIKPPTHTSIPDPDPLGNVPTEF